MSASYITETTLHDGTAYKYVVVVFDDAGRGTGEEFPTVSRARARVEQLRLLGFHDIEICSVPQE